MRLLFLLLITLAVGAAEEECITLKDGRTFTGIYDDIAGTIEVTVGKSSAKMAIKPDQIAQRLATAVKPPERDFIAEASRFDEQQKEAEEKRKQRIIKEQQEKAESDKIIAQLNAEHQQKADADRDEARQAALVVAAERAKRQAEAEEVRRYIAKRQAEAEEDRRYIAMRQAEAEEERNAKEEKQAAERRRAEMAHAKMMEEIQRKSDAEKIIMLHRFEAAETARDRQLLIAYALAFLVWIFPSVFSHYRNFSKRWEVTVLLTLTLITGFGIPMSEAIISRTKPDYANPGLIITAIGWLGALAWVLIASKPRAKKT
jgi:hypothetical protein